MQFSWQDPNLIGLIADLIGVLILGVPALLVPSRVLAKESTSGFGGASKGLARRFSEWKIDTCFASVYLATGFTFQFIAAVGYIIPLRWAYAIWVILLVTSALYLVFRRTVIARFATIIEKHWDS